MLHNSNLYYRYSAIHVFKVFGFGFKYFFFVVLDFHIVAGGDEQHDQAMAAGR